MISQYPPPAPVGEPTFPPARLHRRRRRGLLVLVVVAALAVTAAVLVTYWVRTDDSRRQYIGADGWPSQGQAALVVGDGAPEASSPQRSAPIASVAKVMTAYLVLRAFPLPAHGDGFTLTVSWDDARRTTREQSQDQSVVKVWPGEKLTERQALLALLLPSANNVAEMLAQRVAGDVDVFVGRMNDTAGRLGMHQTHYADPSGFDSRTVSTASDQLTLARLVARDPTFSALAATRSAQLPVAGTIHNTDTLLGHDGFVGTKTGSHDAAGGCFMFRARRVVGGRTVDVIGVVLGQDGRNLIDAGLYAARQLVDRVASTS